MTLALTAALATVAAIAFAVAAETLFRTLVTVSQMYDYLDGRLTDLEMEWEPDTEIDDDEDDEEIDDATEPWERDPDAWKHQ